MSVTDLIPWKRNGKELVRRSPEEDVFLSLQREMNRMFDEFFAFPFRTGSLLPNVESFGDFAPRLDIHETDDQYEVTVELPGMNEDDIHVAIDHGVLTISGEKHAEKEDKGKKYYRIERAYGAFHRAVPLPGAVDEDKVRATYRKGILRVVLPKAESEKSKTRRIRIRKA